MARIPVSILTALTMTACDSDPGTSCPAGQVDVDGACRHICKSDFDCPKTTLVCEQDVCVSGSRQSPVIAAVDGDGNPDGAAGHTGAHLHRKLIISGEHLGGARVSLFGGGDTWEELEICEGTPQRLVAALPDNVQSGTDYSLTVANQAGACEAVLPLLQGEKGDKGDKGDPGEPGEMPPTWMVGAIIEAETAFLADDVETGSSVDDPTASGARARAGAYSAGIGGRLWGVYSRDTTGLFGIDRTRITLRAKVADASVAGVIARFRCAALRAGSSDWSTEGVTLGTVDIEPVKLPGDETWGRFDIYCGFLPDDVDQLIAVDDFALAMTDLVLDYVQIDPMIDDTLTIASDHLDLRGNAVRYADMSGDPRSKYNIMGYHYDSLIRADQKFTVTLGGGLSGSAAVVFDGRPETSLATTTTPATVEIDFGSMQHYWYALTIASPWGTGYGFTSSFLVEKFFDDHSDGDWDGCTSGDPSLQWATVADVSGFEGYAHTVYSGLSNGICKLRFTFRDVVGSQNQMQLGEIAGYQYYQGDTGLYVKSTGDTVYGDLHVSNGSFIDDGTTINAPDYVFEDGYPLQSLAQLRSFIEREKHLPNVPTAQQIKRSGLNVSQFTMTLLEKIEEQLLYTFQQQGTIDTLGAELETLRGANMRLHRRNDALEVQMRRLEQRIETLARDSQ